MDYRGLLVITRTGSAELLGGLNGLPLLEDVDTTRLNRVGGEVKVDAPFCRSRHSGNLNATVQVARSLIRIKT